MKPTSLPDKSLKDSKSVADAIFKISSTEETGKLYTITVGKPGGSKLVLIYPKGGGATLYTDLGNVKKPGALITTCAKIYFCLLKGVFTLQFKWMSNEFLKENPFIPLNKALSKTADDFRNLYLKHAVDIRAACKTLDDELSRFYVDWWEANDTTDNGIHYLNLATAWFNKQSKSAGKHAKESAVPWYAFLKDEAIGECIHLGSRIPAFRFTDAIGLEFHLERKPQPPVQSVVNVTFDEEEAATAGTVQPSLTAQLLSTEEPSSTKQPLSTEEPLSTEHPLLTEKPSSTEQPLSMAQNPNITGFDNCIADEEEDELL